MVIGTLRLDCWAVTFDIAEAWFSDISPSILLVVLKVTANPSWPE